jgi:mannose-6-phosphate isomerase-like protein (cupin superfamily)
VSPEAGYGLGPDDGERLVFGGVTILLKAATDAFALWEERPPLLDTPMHVHEYEDELFHVLDGQHVFRCGDEEFELAPGGCCFLPRRVPHGHRRVVSGVGRLLAMTSPGGFAGFFRMLAKAEENGSLGPDAYAEASARHGITWLS